ncbi:MAG: sulfurtransferase FdhD [Flavobacteriales bacterium]|nr:MAG: sulfurtransferase FdhD [Flavobacteriales bacterium]
MSKFSISPTEIIRLENEQSRVLSDFVCVEEPLEIRLVYQEDACEKEKSIAITMRTPGHDKNLALGFLFNEGIVSSINDVVAIQELENHGGAMPPNPNKFYGNDKDQASEILQKSSSENKPFLPQKPPLNETNSIVRCKLSEGVIPKLNQLERHFYTTSSCGICGKSSIEAVRIECRIPLTPTKWTVERNTLFGLPRTLAKVQENFSHTGGLHASALFDLQGELLLVREDVGRHNALDKLIGASLELGRTSDLDLEIDKGRVFDSENDIPKFVVPLPAQEIQDTFTLPLSHHILLLSGRISFELVQKAAMAGIRLVCAVGAPSSLAIDLAEELGITLIGFLRNERCNIYAHPTRIVY